MKISVIIPYTQGDQLREDALSRLMDSLRIQTTREYEIIVVEDLMGKPRPMFPYQQEVQKFITLQDPQNRKYNKSWSINVGVKECNNESAFIVDADTIFAKDYLEKVIDFAQIHQMFFHGYNWIVLMPGRDNPVVRISQHKYISSTGGTWFTNKRWFFDELGGANEQYFGYGNEDGDIWFRANYLLNGIPEMDYPVVHQYHHWHQADGANPLNPIRGDILNNTKQNPRKIIELLKNTKQGDRTSPAIFGS